MNSCTDFPALVDCFLRMLNKQARLFKNTWKRVRSIISLQKMTNYSPTIISLEDHTVTDPGTIVNTFNGLFLLLGNCKSSVRGAIFI